MLVFLIKQQLLFHSKYPIQNLFRRSPGNLRSSVLVLIIELLDPITFTTGTVSIESQHNVYPRSRMPTIQQETRPPVLIGNQEVMELLERRMQNRPNKRKRPSKLQHCEWIEEKVAQYLKNTPCVRLNSSRRDELRSTLQSSKKSTSGSSTGFALTDAESLQILNSMPAEPVELHLLIEDLHARMTDRQQKELLHFIASFCKDAKNGGKSPSSRTDGNCQSTEEALGETLTETKIKDEN